MKSKEIILISSLALSVIANVALIVNKMTSDPDIVVKEVVTEIYTQDTLSDWEMFTLALMKVESQYDSTAVSSAGAMGYFQITPIYVREVNRIHKTNYTFDQVTNFEDAYEIFDLMQQAHNPDYDMERALDLHNGKHVWYHNRVYQEMERIQKYEQIRKQLKNI